MLRLLIRTNIIATLMKRFTRKWKLLADETNINYFVHLFLCPGTSTIRIRICYFSGLKIVRVIPWAH